jgi:hypothetical protein
MTLLFTAHNLALVKTVAGRVMNEPGSDRRNAGTADIMTSLRHP